MKKYICTLLLIVLPLAAVVAAGAAEEGTQDVVELSASVYQTNQLGMQKQLDNPNNVIVPYIKEKFGVTVSEIREGPADMTVPQVLLMWKAADTVPDIFQAGSEDYGAMVISNVFAPLDKYLENMPNYERFLPRKYWPREAAEADGKTYAFYNLPGNIWPKPEPPSDDVVTPSINHRALWVREDVLTAIGWGFTPLEEVKKMTLDKGIRPTYEQLKVTPEIDTPEKFLDFLRAIKAANLKSIDGQDVIPFSMIGWETWHLGVMFDWGYWRINRAGEVDGYLGLPGTYDYMKWLWTAYREGLIDPDYLVHQHVQLQEKVATGRIAAGEYVRDSINVFAQLEENVQGATRHFIPFPKSSPEYGFYDPYNPHPYLRTLINKDLSDDVVQRIADFVDWSYSDEGQEILAWGPADAGLYKIVDGRKRFIDPAVEEAVLGGDVDGPGAFEYGIYDSKAHGAPDPFTKAFGPGALVKTVFTEYNMTSYWPGLMSSIVASDERFLGVSTKLQVANSDQSEVVQGVADWYWGIFPQSYLPQLLKAENAAEFEDRFKQLMNAFESETNYAEAKKNMEAYFKKFPPIWD